MDPQDVPGARIRAGWWSPVRRWWRLVTTVVAAAAGVFAYITFNDTLTAFTSGGVVQSSGGGGFGHVPSVSIPQPPPAASVVPVPPHLRETAAVADVGDTVTVRDNGVARTVNCAGGSVIISGFDNTVLATGDCFRVDISGSRNVIRITDSAAIGVSGADNQVFYYSPNPEITDTGVGNVFDAAPGQSGFAS